MSGGRWSLKLSYSADSSFCLWLRTVVDSTAFWEAEAKESQVQAQAEHLSYLARPCLKIKRMLRLYHSTKVLGSNPIHAPQKEKNTIFVYNEE